MRRRDVLRAAGAALGAGVLGGPATRVAGAAPDSDEYGQLGSVFVDGAREAVVAADGRTAFLALGDGYAIVDVSDPASPTVLAARRGLLGDRSDGPLRLVNDVSVSGDRLLAVAPAHQREGVLRGVLAVDVSDPADPIETGFYETGFPIHNCAFDGRYCYLTGNGEAGNPLIVVDVDEQREVSRWSLVDATDVWTAVSPHLRTIHDVTVRDGVAALAYWDAGTVLLDVADPADPTLLGHVAAGDPADLRDPSPRTAIRPPGNHHYSLLSPGGDLLAVGRETWAVDVEGEVLGGPSGVDLYDVSDPTAPVRRASIDPPPTPDATFAGTWTTAHNLDIREETLYTSWYQGGVKRHDVSDPSAPVEETWWADPESTRFWTAVCGVPGEFFLAPSMGTRGGASAGLWTFPDVPGAGGDRSRFPLTDTPRATAESTASPSRSTTDWATTTPTDVDGISRAAGPGFGQGVAAAGLVTGTAVALALGRVRRRRGSDDGRKTDEGDADEGDADEGDADEGDTDERGTDA